MGQPMSGTQLINTQALAQGNSGQGEALQDGGFKINLHALTTPIGADTINAGYFAWDPDTGASLGRTAVQIIQAAINYAVTNSYGAVWIPKKVGSTTLLPYDASQVTFNNAVRMVREGQGSLEEFDVKAYGAAGNGSQNDYPGCHAAELAAGAWIAAGLSGGAVVSVPLGIYNLSEPWQITARGVTIRGQGYVQFNRGEGMTRLRGSYAYGPLMMVGDWTIPTTTALVGSGSALRFVDDTYGWFNLRDARTLDVHGLSAFTIEGFISFDTLTNDVQRTIVKSKGQWRLNDTAVSSFSFRQEPFAATTRLVAIIKTSNGTFTAASAGGALNAATVYHIALSWDGVNLRLYAAVPGTSSAPLATTAATGTLVQDVSEDVFLGPEMRFTPDGYNALTNGFGATGGTLDSFRISDNARYTGTFTAPTAKFVNDGNTLLLMNFDKQVGPMTRAYTKNGDAYLVHRPFTAFGASVIDNNGKGSACEIANIGYDDPSSGHTGLVIGSNISNVTLRRLRGFECRVGINLFPNSFFFRWEDCLFQESGNTGTRYGIQFGNNSSYGSIAAVTIVGYTVPFVSDGGHVSADNLNILTGVNSLTGLLIRGSEKHGSWVFDDLYVDTEVGTASGYLGGVVLTMSLAPEAALFNGGIIEGARSTSPIYCDAWSSAIFNGTVFSDFVGVPSMMAVHASGVPTIPVQFNACPILGTWIPWSGTAGTAIVGKIGPKTVTFGATPEFKCDLGDDFFLSTVLTANVTGATFTNVTPSQEIRLWVQQNGAGGFTFNTPANVKGMTAIDTVANHWSQWVFKVGLDLNLYQHSFNSGA